MLGDPIERLQLREFFVELKERLTLGSSSSGADLLGVEETVTSAAGCERLEVLAGRLDGPLCRGFLAFEGVEDILDPWDVMTHN